MNRHPYELLHVPTGLVLKVYREDLGHPYRPGLWDELRLRATKDGNVRSRSIKPGELQCLYCLDEGYGQRWVHLVEKATRHGRTRFPRHFDGSIRDHVDTSAEHQALVERVGRDVEAHDRSLRFGTEVRSPDGSWIADGLVLASGRPAVDFEAQLSPMGRDAAIGRDRVRREAGVQTVWTPRNNRVPWARGLIPTAVIADPNAAYLRAGEPIPVRGGIRFVSEERCGRGRPCPNGRQACGRMHLHLETPGEATQTEEYAGRRTPDLGSLVADIALGAWQAITDRYGNWMFAPADHAARWLAEVGDTTRAGSDQGQGDKTRASAKHRFIPAELAQPQVLDWRDRSHWAARPGTCRVCRLPSMLLDDQGRPCHKTCAESETAGGSR